ncbi:MAG TPA: hypothetical protein VE010_20185 [Thermoanaerobaculia bacterium]|nr:hypothetical protein [Thermoanaerobaculia bacterium]
MLVNYARKKVGARTAQSPMCYLALIALLVVNSRCTSASRHSSFVTPLIVSIEECTASARPPDDCVYVQLPLSDADERRIRGIIHSARRRQMAEAREAERNGQITGGVWGFVSYSYRLAFADGSPDGERRWLHISDRAAWLEGSSAVGPVVVTPEESVLLRRTLQGGL